MPIQGGSGGGNQARDVRAGGGFFELYLKDELSKELDKAKGKVGLFGKYMQGVGQGLSGSLLFGGAAGAGMAAAQKIILPLFEKMGSHLDEVIFKTKELTEASERQVATYQRMASAAARFSTGALAATGTIADPSFASSYLERQIATADRELERLRSHRVAEWKAGHDFGDNAGERLMSSLGFGSDARKLAMERFGAADAALKAAKGEREKMVAELTRLNLPETMAAFRAPLTGLEQRMRDALDPAIQGMGEFERAVLALQRDDKFKTLATDLDRLRGVAATTDLALKNLPNAGAGFLSLVQGGIGAALQAATLGGQRADWEKSMEMVKGGFRADSRALNLGDRVGQMPELLRGLIKQEAETTKAVHILKDFYTLKWCRSDSSGRRGRRGGLVRRSGGRVSGGAVVRRRGSRAG